MILEPKEHQRVDTPYKYCWSIFFHLCWQGCSIWYLHLVPYVLEHTITLMEGLVLFLFTHPSFGCWYYHTLLIFEMVCQIFLQSSFVVFFFCQILKVLNFEYVDTRFAWVCEWLCNHNFDWTYIVLLSVWPWAKIKMNSSFN